MKKIEVSGNEHANLNERTKGFLKELNDMGIVFKFKLADILKERNLSIRECAKITGLRIATISDLMNGNKSSINLHHVLIIMACLRVTKFEDIIEIYIPDKEKMEYISDSETWIKTGELPSMVNVFIKYWSGESDSLK